MIYHGMDDYLLNQYGSGWSTSLLEMEHIILQAAAINTLYLLQTSSMFNKAVRLEKDENYIL